MEQNVGEDAMNQGSLNASIHDSISAMEERRPDLTNPGNRLLEEEARNSERLQNLIREDRPHVLATYSEHTLMVAYFESERVRNIAASFDTVDVYKFVEKLSGVCKVDEEDSSVSTGADGRQSEQYDLQRLSAYGSAFRTVPEFSFVYFACLPAKRIPDIQFCSTGALTGVVGTERRSGKKRTHYESKTREVTEPIDQQEKIERSEKERLSSYYKKIKKAHDENQEVTHDEEIFGSDSFNEATQNLFSISALVNDEKLSLKKGIGDDMIIDIEDSRSEFEEANLAKQMIISVNQRCWKVRTT